MEGHFSQHIFNLEGICRKMTSPRIVRIEHSSLNEFEQPKMQSGDVVQICELRNIQTVTGYLTDGLVISGERLEPDDFEISIPVKYPEPLKVLHDMKNYSLVSEIYKDSPRFVRAKETVMIPQGASLLTFEKDTVVEVLLRLKGAVRAFNQRGVDKIRIRYQQNGRDMEADIPVNTRAMFRSEPDGTRYTIADAIARYALPTVVAFETNFIEELFAERFPELSTQRSSVPDTIKLTKVVTQEVLTFCPVSTAHGQSRYSVLPKTSLCDVKVRILKEDSGTPYQYCHFEDDDSYDAVIDTPWLVYLADVDDYEPVTPKRETVGEFAKQQPVVEDKQENEESDKASLPEINKSGGLTTRAKVKIRKLVASSQSLLSSKLFHKKSEATVAPPRENKITTVYKRSKSEDEHSIESEDRNTSSESEECGNYDEIDPETFEVPSGERDSGTSQEPSNSQDGNSSDEYGNYDDIDQETFIAQDDTYDSTTRHGPSKSEEGNALTESDDDNDYICMEGLRVSETSSERKEEEKKSGSYVTITNAAGNKDFKKLDVHEVCERLHTCGLGKLAKIGKTKFYDGHDFSNIEPSELKNEPFMLSEFEVVKFERVKNNWVPNF